MTNKQKILVEVASVLAAVVLCAFLLVFVTRQLAQTVKTLAPKAKEAAIELIGDVAEEIHKRTADAPDGGG